MARVLFGIERGLKVYGVNSNSSTDILFGSAAPGGDSGEQDAASIGSLYLRSTGLLYQKLTSTNSAADWEFFPLVLSAGYAAVNGTVAIGDTIEEAIEKLDGNQIDLIALSGVAQGAVDLGTFTGATIPDSSTIKAALQSLETAHEEVDQNVNDLITLSGVAENATHLGTFTGATIPDSSTVKAALQSLETSLEEIDQNVNDLITLSGVAENATHLGTFTGSIIPDSSTVKAALQSLETYVEAISGGSIDQSLGVTTATVVSFVLVDDSMQAEWEVVIEDAADEANRVFEKITALHDGTSVADAVNVDDTAFVKLKVGTNFNYTVSVTLTGTGASQQMNLSVASTEPSGVNVYARKTHIL